MIRAWITKKKIKIEAERDIPGWEQSFSEEQILKWQRYWFENAVQEEIKKIMSVEIDQEMVSRIAKTLLDELDFKKAISEVMHEKLKDYLNRL